MSKTGRLWFPLDANFTRDPTILDAGERAAWLYLAILGQLKSTGAQGIITLREIKTLGIPIIEPRLRALERVGLLKQTDARDVYELPAWHAWNAVSYDRAAYMRAWRARQKTEHDEPP